ncbi:MAG: hypothetical protein Q8S53_10040 [Brevundimonas sp.]|uniref:hypothetical protein n=1 Tax=Brevundimonas sp. TaxID=1871086 RepID=UPI002736E507|nr:hypothetical protein [Brevundimonas sp.]MDP3378693.1 hypothetical protein [Brevundimonas sp.]
MSEYINVQYRNIDGAHVFTSEEATGLYVMKSDPRVAFECVSEGVSRHFRNNDNVDVKVEADMSVEEFLGRIGEGESDVGHPHFRVYQAALRFKPVHAE